MRAVLFSLTFLAASASAETLRMKRIEATNLHTANRAGARNWSWDYTITIELGAKGKVSVTSAGKRRNHDMTMIGTRPYNTDERSTWITTWQGTWSKTGKGLELVLDLGKHDCTGEKDDNGTKSALPCQTPTPRAAITCTSDTIEIENTGRTKTTKTAAWMCSPAGVDTALAESTGPWIFAKTGCVVVHGGKMTSNSFSACP